MYSVPDSAPQEDKAICELMNRGFDPQKLFRAAYTFYGFSLEQKMSAGLPVVVRSGLFEGMTLYPKSLASQLLPKCQGTYEKEVQDFLHEYCSDSDVFIDIGCAEGFYLSGVARWAKIPCMGIDIDPRSAEAVRFVAEANGVAELVSFSPDMNNLMPFLRGSIACLVDVDGSEIPVLKSLLSLMSVSSTLSTVNLLVETDNQGSGVQNTPELVKLLCQQGFSVQSILKQNPANRFVGVQSEMSFMEQVVRGAEGRPGGQAWIFATRRFS
ncbi:hypothetical protein [Synechococcus sp. UW179B]|uniref:hypothetical protein n=1 Tax=Synechococcus sp. UW179B TaxID=2575516 RepID=UPI000E0F8B8B|nr:hypothetical protein [Synechococcus sp. UW179B]